MGDPDAQGRPADVARHRRRSGRARHVERACRSRRRLRTGDVGYMDEDGYLYITDRRADMVLSGGANIYPAEVEGAIESCPGVRSCAVIALRTSFALSGTSSTASMQGRVSSGLSTLGRLPTPCTCATRA